MKLDVGFSELDEQRKKLGAPLPEWNSKSEPLTAREQLLRELSDGIEINLDDVSPGPGGLLVYQGEQIVLYIKDTRSTLWTLENQPEKSRRFHIAECKTLETMRQAGRFERYVVANRMDDKFRVDWLDDETGETGETDAALKVCKNCLKQLNYRGYDTTEDRLIFSGGQRQTKGSIWESFSMSEFLMDYSTFFTSKPTRTADSALINRYVPQWAKISENLRRQKEWICEGCGVDLSKAPNLLHAHHRNGVKTDNKDANLEVLCGLCHSEQPMHSHMTIPASDKLKILKFRSAQNR